MSDENKTMSKLRSNMTESGKALLTRMGLASLAGLMTLFGGKRDLYQVYGYPTNPTHEMIVSRYLHQDIANRIINAPPNATWTDELELRKDGKAWKSWDKFVQSCNDSGVSIRNSLRKLDIFAGLGSYAVMVCGFDDGASLETPLNPRRVKKLLYLQPYLEGDVDIVSYETDNTSPRFGKPLMYQITPGTTDVQTGNTSARLTPKRAAFKCHYTRLLHVADNTLRDDVMGVSRMIPVFNRLCDLDKIVGGAAETYWLTSNRGMHANVEKDMQLDPQSEADLTDEIDEYTHELRRVIRTRGVEITSLGGTVADPSKSFSVCMQCISAVTGIPIPILLGEQSANATSVQARALWSDTVNERTDHFAEPLILRPFITLMMSVGLLKGAEGYTVNWPDPYKMNPIERAQASAQIARSATNMARAMQVAQSMGQPICSVEEARQIIAPGAKVIMLTGLPAGQVPPPVDTVDPKKIMPGDPRLDSEDPETDAATDQFIARGTNDPNEARNTNNQ